MSTKRIRIVNSLPYDKSLFSMDLFDCCEQCEIFFDDLMTKICKIINSTRKSNVSNEHVDYLIRQYLDNLDVTLSNAMLNRVVLLCKDVITKAPKKVTDKDSISNYINRFIEQTKKTKANKTKFPKLISKEFVGLPSGKSSEELFVACVKYLAYYQCELEYKNHNQWASMLFRKCSSIDAKDKMSKIKHDFDIYFLPKKLSYTFDVDKIVSHFSYLFKSTDALSPIKSLFKDIQQALINEFSESKLTKNRQIYKLLNLEKIKSKQLIYDCDILTNDEEIPHFREGLSFKISINSTYFTCEVVDYDIAKEHLYFTSQKELPEWGEKYAIIDTSFIIESLRKRISTLSQSELDSNLPIYKFIVNDTQNVSFINHAPIPKHIYEKLDSAQFDAFNAAISNDITFVWGPPGTGKSFTLAAIIRALYEFQEERTVVCCVSNVAVDELAKKVIDIVNNEKLIVDAGNFYRAGHSTDEKILATDYLFPKDDATTMIRKEIEMKHKKLESLSLSQASEQKDAIIEIKAEIKDLRVCLKNHTEYLVGKSRVVYSTIANFILNEQINNSKFDNLIVDEASMLALPQLIALAKNVTKRIILVGDFQQLSPISLVPDKHLRDNVFKIAGICIGNTSHKALHLLMNQRRSHVKIVDIINKVFYDGKLHAEIYESNDLVNAGPFNGRVISTVSVMDSAYRFTKGGTRQNVKSAEYIISLLNEYSNGVSANFSIGIITPYKGQASLLKALLMEQNYEQQFLERIKIGTVHTFQGSECDIIIYDIVDCDKCENQKNLTTGKIYGGKEGEQLLNVALSRARYKLIIVGDAEYFQIAKGNQMSTKTLGVFNILSAYKVRTDK